MTLSVKLHKLESVANDCILQLAKQDQAQQWTFFLDSCQQSNMGGRYDILASTPCITYQYTRGKHCLAGSWLSQDANKLNAPFLEKMHALVSEEHCPYQNLETIHLAFTALFDRTSIENEHIPFIVGALGAFGYDGNTSSDNIPDPNPKQYEMADISVGFYHSSLIYDNLENTLYICSIDELFIQQQIKRIGQLQGVAKQCGDDFNLLAPWQTNLNKQAYQAQFAKIKTYLVEGDCYQVNFAQRYSAPYAGSEWSAYARLRDINKAPFSAFVRLGNSTLLSLSPERFLLVKDTIVETKPIKGTRQRNDDPIEDAKNAQELLSAEKDRAENLMIVDLLRNDLSKHCQAHSVEVPALFALESYPAVHHMVSTVRGKLKTQSSLYSLLKGAFPGGSITGAPKVRAMQIIQELEPDKRAIYCGSIGYFGIRNDMDTNICIRTLLAEKDMLYCWAGGGIVNDSNAIDEYQESKDKVAKIVPVLAAGLVTDKVKQPF